MEKNELQQLHFEVQNECPVASSRDVVEHFRKTHKNILKMICGENNWRCTDVGK